MKNPVYPSGFRGFIYAIDEDHREIMLESINGETRMIVQPIRWEDRYHLWLDNKRLIFARGLLAHRLPLIMKAEVEVSEQDGVMIYSEPKEITWETIYETKIPENL